MSLEALIRLALQASLFLTVLALGLNAGPEEAAYLFRRRRRLLQTIASLIVIMPLWAATLALTFDVHPSVELVLLTLVVSPVPPLLPRKAFETGGTWSYAISMLVAAVLLAIVGVPLGVKWLGSVFATSVDVPAAA